MLFINHKPIGPKGNLTNSRGSSVATFHHCVFDFLEHLYYQNMEIILPLLYFICFVFTKLSYLLRSRENMRISNIHEKKMLPEILKHTWKRKDAMGPVHFRLLCIGTFQSIISELWIEMYHVLLFCSKLILYSFVVWVLQ